LRIDPPFSEIVGGSVEVLILPQAGECAQRC
jgi:hypothetical protein